MSKANGQKVILAVDVLEPSLEQQKHVVEAIGPLVRALRAEVEPVYVLNWAQTRLGPVHFDVELDFFFRQAQERMEKWVRKIRRPWIGEAKILVNDSRTQRGAIKALSDYAVESGARLIVTRTYGRKGVLRWFLGSFAETLLLHSRVPVLTVGPEAKPLSRIQDILFPTDFGRQSDHILQQVADLAAQTGAIVTVFHAEALSETGGLLQGPYPLDVSVPAPRKGALRVRRKAEDYASVIRSAGGRAKVVLNQDIGADGDRILAYAETAKPEMIVMAAQSGPLQALAGSVARHVVRGAQCPVWVLNQRMVRAKKQKARRAA